MKPLRVLDLFSGIGGFSLGLEAAGFRTVAFCEISAVCRHLLNHHWPEVPAYDDVCSLTAERLGADGIGVDVICGGFPCQDISFAGRGAGLAGERSGLWREYARLIGELRPRYVIVENVAALLGRGLGDVLGDLAALGYDAWWDCIPAAAVGAPHRRDRLWAVAYAGSIEHEGFGDALRRAVSEELLGAHTVADASGQRQPEAGRIRRDEPSERATGRRQAVADHDRQRPSDDQGGCEAERFAGLGAADRSGGLGGGRLDWRSEPDVGRVAHGIPARVDRLHGLGNAVVPQIPEILGRAILASRSAQGQPASKAGAPQLREAI